MGWPLQGGEGRVQRCVGGRREGTCPQLGEKINWQEGPSEEIKTSSLKGAEQPQGCWSASRVLISLKGAGQWSVSRVLVSHNL